MFSWPTLVPDKATAKMTSAFEHSDLEMAISLRV